MEIAINTLEHLSDAAKIFAEHIEQGRVYAFYGKMGAGKTTFIKAVCEALGVTDVVNSPTFAIVNEYDCEQFPVYHFDFYRIKSVEEVYDLGYEDYFYGNGICLIEWPELVESLLPEDAIHVNITVNDDDSRLLTISD